MKTLLLAAVVFSMPALAVIEETEKPERLRDRLINIENTVSDYKSLAAQSNDEFKSLSVRMKNFETLVHDLNSSTTVLSPVKHEKVSQVEPYAYVAF